MNLNKNFLTEVIKYLINRGVTLADVMDTFNEHFNTSDAFSDSLKNMPTEIKRGTINNVIEEPVLPKYTMTESDKISLESVSPSPEALNKVFDTSKEHEKHDEVRKPITDIDLLLCGRELEKQGFNKDIKEHVTDTESVTESPYKLVPTPPTKVSLSPNKKDYPTSTTPRGRGVSKARKMLFEVVEGKTVLEHLKANNINYKLFDTRIRKNWTMEKACTTPMTRVIKPYTKSKKPEEHKAVIIPDTNVKCLEPEKITGTKKRMMLVNGVMTEIDVSDTDLVQSSMEKPAETLEIKTETLETENNTEKATESVTNATALNGNNVTAVIPDTPNPDAIHGDKDDYIEKALKKFITSTTGIEFEESKKDKKPKEVKADLTVLEVCQKMNVTTHELKEMIATGDFPQPDCDKKWSVKLLKKEGII